jgi:phosphoglycerol transferase
LNRLAYVLALALASIALASCGQRQGPASTSSTEAAAASYHATLDEGIAFTKPGYPDFVAKTEGIGIAEPFGHWTDGPVAAIEFKEPLPKKFDLVLTGAAFGPNVDQPVKVTIGAASQDVTFDGDVGKGAQTRRLPFSLEQPASRIEFHIPHPTQPSNGDVRKLGIALVGLKIEAPAK